MRRRGEHEASTSDTVLVSRDDAWDDGHDSSNSTHTHGKKRRLKLWLVSQWRNGNLRDKSVLVLLAFLVFTTVFVGIPYRLFFATAKPDRVVIAGQRIPIDGTATTTTIHIPKEPTIHIPMEDIPEKEGPSMVLFRFLESWSRKRLRFTGEQALVQFGDQLRELMLLGSDLFSPSQDISTDTVKLQQLREILQKMAPWIRGDPSHDTGWPLNQVAAVPSPYQADPHSKAVVICAGDKQLWYLDALLNTIRNVHRSNIPVRIVFQGDADLSQQSRQKLATRYTSEGDLQFIDLATIFVLDDKKVQLKGWNLKPFGMLAVPEAQVALLDVDVLLLRPPEALFESQGYIEKGALFFRDRSGGEHLWTPRQFMLSMQPHLSPAAQHALTFGNILNEHIQEAGVVVIDKSRRWRGLWTACLILGRLDVRRFIQRDLIYGDKEVYFTAFETIHEPYAFAKYYPGVIGSVLSDFHGDDLEWTVDTLPPQSSDNNNKQIYELGPYMALCGRMLHFDDEGLPLWSNGGYLTREDDRDASDVASRGLKPLLFVDGGDSTSEDGSQGKEGNQNWKFHHGLGVLCILPNSRSIQKVPNASAETGGEAVDYYVKSSGWTSW